MKKNLAWSAGAMRKRSAALITAKTPAMFGLRNSKISPAIGINTPTTLKKAANHNVRSSFMRVSNPNGVNRNPRIIPNPNKTASIRSGFPKDAVVLDDLGRFITLYSLATVTKEP